MLEYVPFFLNSLRKREKLMSEWDVGKLQPFSLVEYERVVQLDSDMILRKNMDELMDLALDIEGDRVFAASHACVCNPLKKAHYPKDWYDNCDPPPSLLLTN